MITSFGLLGIVIHSGKMKAHIRRYFIRISRLKFAKFYKYFKNKPEAAQIVKGT